MNNEARGHGKLWVSAFFWLILVVTLAGCALTEKKVRPEVYDFGATALATASAPAAAPSLPPLALGDVQANQALDSLAILYRLGYADAQQLRPYAHARWSAPPAQLVRQRLREILSQRRTVVNASESTVPLVLRVELEEFSQQFGSPTQSDGVIRLNVTLSKITATGELPVAQRSVRVQRPAPTEDAAGGVQALAAATDAAAHEIGQWLASLQ